MSARYEIGCTEDAAHHWIDDKPGKEYEDRCPVCNAYGVKNYGRLITETADVTDDIVDYAIDTADGFFPPGEPIDWSDLIDRMESVGADGLNFGNSMESPAIRKIQRAVREARRAM